MPELKKSVTQEDMTLYSGPGNIHSDPEVAKRTGLEATVAQGMMMLAYASELMTRIRGRPWLEWGHIAVKFTKPVYSGDEVTVEAIEAEGSYELEARNQDGEVVMIGTASLSSPDSRPSSDGRPGPQ